MTPEEVELLSQLTIVIPTYNRPLELERSIEYWRDTPVTVHILDGSEKPCFPSGVIPGATSITYHHIPPMCNEPSHDNYTRRMQFAATLPDTKFSALGAVDDFFSYSGLKLAILRLLKNQEIDAFVGICAEYKKTDSGLLWHARYTDWRAGLKSRSNDVAERVLDDSGAFYLYYGLMRSEIWKKVFSLVFEFSYEFPFQIESLHSAIANAHCRVVVERHLFWIKDSWIPSGVVPPRGADWFRNRNNKTEVKFIVEHMQTGVASGISRSFSTLSASSISKKFIRRNNRLFQTTKFRKIVSLVMQWIVLKLSFLPNSVKSCFNFLLPRRFRIIIGAVSPLPFKHLLKNNWRALDPFINELSRTDIGFVENDFAIIERLLLKPREELRLRANI